MSLRGINEFVLQIEHFRNIDLLQQGCYFMRFQVYHEAFGHRFFAHPYQHDVRQSESLSSFASDSALKMMPSSIYEDKACFCTRTFFIRYAEENVTFKDIVKFRTEVDTSILGYTEMPFFVRVELYWLPPYSVLNSTQVTSKDMDQYLKQAASSEFQMV